MSRPPSGGELDWGVGVEGGVPRSRGVSVEGEEGESGTASPQGGGESGAASEVVPVERESSSLTDYWSESTTSTRCLG